MTVVTRSRHQQQSAEQESESMATDDEEKHEAHTGFSQMSPSDKKSVLLLTFLYVLQGIPLGLSGSIPYILTERHASYSAQGTFSLVTWPFSIKILWAPVVDAIYSSRLGRRKCWLVPVQYGIGFGMLVMSIWVNSWIGDTGGSLKIYHLTAGFMLLNFLAATQDVAVDGWALTMLSKKNVGWASTCNSVGQTAGYFIAYILFLALESPKFSNNWLRSVPSDQGVVTMGGFLFFWGIVFLVTTTLVMMFKSEGRESIEDELNLKDTYLTLFKIIKLKPIQQYVLTVFLIKAGFAAADAITGLKLIERGVPKESLAFLGVLIVPLQIVLPLIISRYTAGPRPLDTMYSSCIPRLIVGLCFAPVVFVTPWFRESDGRFPLYFYGFILLVFIIHQVFAYTFFVCQMGFHARVSDPKVGGTYMTLLNTCSNLAGNLPSTVALYFVDPLTFMYCSGGERNGERCLPQKGCGKDGVCSGLFDGYFVEMAIFFVIGVLALTFRRRTVNQLQNLHSKRWLVT